MDASWDDGLCRAIRGCWPDFVTSTRRSYRTRLSGSTGGVTPTYGLVRYWSPTSATPSAATPLSPEITLCFMEGTTPPEMHEVVVVCDFPDVFPEELPGMPPD